MDDPIIPTNTPLLQRKHFHNLSRLHLVLDILGNIYDTPIPLSYPRRTSARSADSALPLPGPLPPQSIVRLPPAATPPYSSLHSSPTRDAIADAHHIQLSHAGLLTENERLQRRQIYLSPSKQTHFAHSPTSRCGNSRRPAAASPATANLRLLPRGNPLSSCRLSAQQNDHPAGVSPTGPIASERSCGTSV